MGVLKKLAVFILTAALSLAMASAVMADLAETQNVDKYITVDKDALPVYTTVNEDGLPVYGTDYYVGKAQRLKLKLEVPLDELGDGIYETGLDRNIYFKLEINNAEWRKDASYFSQTVADYDSALKWDFNILIFERAMTAKNMVSYDEDFYKRVQYLNAHLNGDEFYLADVNIIDGEIPLIFRTKYNGDVNVDVSVYTGENLFDNSKYVETDFKYIGTLTVANVGGQKTYQEAKTAEETTSETTSETATQTVTEKPVEIEIPIGQSYYTVNGTTAAMDSTAFIENGYTMLPLRAMSEIIGLSDSDICYDAAAKTAVINYENTVISVSAGERAMYINGVYKIIDSPVVIKDGRMYLPMRAVAQALGFDAVSFDANVKLVKITV